MSAPSDTNAAAASRRAFLASAAAAIAAPTAFTVLGAAAPASAAGSGYAPVPPSALGPALNADGYFVGRISRFTRDAPQHPTYQALAELGKAVKTVFLCRYLHLEALRREIHDGLNVVENWNSANSFIFYGKGGEISTNRRIADQDCCKRGAVASAVSGMLRDFADGVVPVGPGDLHRADLFVLQIA
jgi:hypothetical protein